MSFTYTPYDGSAAPFTVGLKPLDPARWFEPDGLLADQLIQKQRLIAQDRAAVFRALPDSRASQAELLEVMLAYLPVHYPDLYAVDGGEVHILPSEARFSIEAYRDDPLLLAGQLVQDDLCLIQVTEEGPVLSAASLCFPSSWKLADKIGRHLNEVHAPVPGYAADIASKVNLMMARLPADRIIWRLNWSLDEGPELHRPAPHSHDSWLEAGADPLDHVYIRVERQTLRRLPGTGGVVFAIRIYTDQLSALLCQPEAQNLGQGLLQQLEVMEADQLAYKGLTTARPVIAAALQEALATL